MVSRRCESGDGGGIVDAREGGAGDGDRPSAPASMKAWRRAATSSKLTEPVGAAALARSLPPHARLASLEGSGREEIPQSADERGWQVLRILYVDKSGAESECL